MSKKIMVQVPSYIYIEATPQLLQLLINAPMYEYDWDSKKYFKADSDRMEIRTTGEEHINATITKDAWKALGKEEEAAE